MSDNLLELLPINVFCWPMGTDPSAINKAVYYGVMIEQLKILNSFYKKIFSINWFKSTATYKSIQQDAIFICPYQCHTVNGKLYYLTFPHYNQ